MSRISVLVTPRDENPYQRLLYGEMSSLGVTVHYADGPTPSHTLNIFLAPFLFVWYRFRGYRILHIHWFFQFALPWAGHRRWVKYVMEWWFRLYLFAAVRLGLQIVWTAHDLTSFDSIFRDDRWARDLLVAKSQRVVALSDASALELRDRGAKRVCVLPFGPITLSRTVTAAKDDVRARLGLSSQDVIVTLMGRVERYKGADLLLIAAQALPRTTRIKVMIVGSCGDEKYRSEILSLAKEIDDRTVLVLEWIPEGELEQYLLASDFAAFPFRDITNSSSVILAESLGLPVVIPNLTLLSDIPEETAIRYVPEGGTATDSLTAALVRAEHLSDDAYEAMSLAASAWAHRRDWSILAQGMVEIYESILGVSNWAPGCS